MDYISLHQNPIDFYYYDPDDNRLFVRYVGFKDQTNLKDPIVACGTQEDTCIESIKNTNFGLRGCYSNKRIERFKVFIPPGTFSIALISHVGQSSGAPYKYVVVARLGQPPDNPYNTSPTSTDGFRIEALRVSDCVAGNVAGYLNICIDSNINIQTESEGGWLYMSYLIVSGPSDGIDIGMTHIVRVGDENTVGTFMHWHSRKAIFDENGDPMGESSTGTLLRCIPESLDFGLVSLTYSGT